LITKLFLTQATRHKFNKENPLISRPYVFVVGKE
jgi:hypothetical protein